MMTNREMIEELRENRVSLIEGKRGLVLATRNSAWVSDRPENLLDTLPYDMLIMVYPEILLINEVLVKDLKCFRLWSSSFYSADMEWRR